MKKSYLIIGAVCCAPVMIFIGMLLLMGGVFTVNTEVSESSKKTDGYNQYGFTCAMDGFDKSTFKQGFVGRGVLEGYAEAYITYADKYGIDPVLLASISFHETANGTSKAVVQKNNTGGLMIGGSLYHFKSIEDSLDVQAKSIRNRISEIIQADGKYTLEALRDRYAPLGASNDPDNLNQHWLPRIIDYATEIGGFTMNCEATFNASVDGASLPLNQITPTSPYGYRINPVTGKSELHAGSDFSCGLNDPIYSVWDGIVFVSKYHWSWGNYIAVLHPDGNTTLYAHMNELGRPVGSKVKAGEQIGKCGTTGTSTGTHLHLEFRTGQDAQNIGSQTITKDIKPIILQIQNNLSVKK
ncbi:M23 family metallopeptidase [Lysinibacillus sphaericus]|uniref:M23 family metallopeptidase n=1 Tax=Lysinibacillus sphaericus TaxID=1421 RepID=UPI0018CD8541|nr:peptidoglycan DD-metalloendopeptidase family protein [Lysinibacillus sphaericus]